MSELSSRAMLVAVERQCSKSYDRQDPPPHFASKCPEGLRRCSGARSEDGTAIPKGAEVVVQRYEKGIAYVRRWEDMAGETEDKSRETEDSSRQSL